MCKLPRYYYYHYVPLFGLPPSCSTSQPLQWIHMRTRLRIVDNSAIGQEAIEAGKPARCIHVYNKTGRATTGDMILVAVRGQKRKALVVGARKPQNPMIPRFQSNNIVLINDDGTPIGTRITVPIPHRLREMGNDITKILAIATKFV